ncbi:hypothetical protein LO772_32550 [Yinghuangia sp. ASG 101]|uniref:hypothetical protein n=1 Tax=Yinghuangia sp. ASG 101 TaxID=2896848 RepID=UPI001E3ACBEA|nr:hypothetical protein [Yinghuangia sp. ASG 101]UGQ11466.1 hypothetical protein LO772_32550 [Yinghuangia sp. ASG 101]
MSASGVDGQDDFGGEARHDQVALDNFEHASLAALERGEAPPPQRESHEFRAWADEYQYNKNAAKALELGDPIPPRPGTSEYFGWALERSREAAVVERIFVGDDMEPTAGTPEHEAWNARQVHDREAVRRMETGENPLPATREERLDDRVDRAHNKAIFDAITEGREGPPLDGKSPEAHEWYRKRNEALLAKIDDAFRNDPPEPEASSSPTAAPHEGIANQTGHPTARTERASAPQQEAGNPPSAAKATGPDAAATGQAGPAPTRPPAQQVNAAVDKPVGRAAEAGLSPPAVTKPSATPQRQSPHAVNTGTVKAAPSVSPYKAAHGLQLSRDKKL